MASENASYNGPPATSEEAPATGRQPRLSSRAPGQDLEGQLVVDEGVYTTGAIPSIPTVREPPLSPSDMERGIAGLPADARSRPRPVLPIDMPNQGLGSGTSLPPPISAPPIPVIYGPTGAQYDTRLHSDHSPRSQRGDPFASNQNSPHNSIRNGTPPESVLDRHRSYDIGTSPTQGNIRGDDRLGGPQGRAAGSRYDSSGESQGSRRQRQAGDDERYDSANYRTSQHIRSNDSAPALNIPGAFPLGREAGLDGPGSRGRRDNAAAGAPGDAHVGSAQGHDPHESLDARLRHAATDYLHDTFPSYDLPALPGRLLHQADGLRRRVTDEALERGISRAHSVVDHVVPIHHASDMEKGPHVAGSVSSRLSATLDDAASERDKYASKAKITGLALNVAIGLQVLLGSLTTGLSAVATQGKSAAVSTTILGALSTVVASYLARARGSNEPELSITRVKDLEQFIRECKNFERDHGDDTTSKYDAEIEKFRARFESLLGNANGERRLSPTGGAF